MAEEQVSLRLLVGKKNNRVLSAAAGKDFVDALFSFLALPLGTIARIVSRDSNMKPVSVGSLNSLYESVANMDEKHFWNETYKEMLLRPNSSMESHQNLKINTEDTEPTKYFICEEVTCSRRKSVGLLSTFKNKRCICGAPMNREISLDGTLLSKMNQGYVNDSSSFNISDDLKVKPNGLESSILEFWKNLGIEDMHSIEEIAVNVNAKELVDLLKFSLMSKTPLTDLFLQKKEVQKDSNLESLLAFEIGTVPAPTDNIKCMKVKVVLQKSKSKVLFAHVEEDFADFLLSFLSLPLGAVLNLLQGNSGLNCLDNLFKSLSDLHEGRHLKSEEIKKILTKPQIASQFKLQNKILPVDVATGPNYSCCSFRSRIDDEAYLANLQQDSCYKQFSPQHQMYAPLTSLDAKSSSPSGFLKGPSMFMVTDDLILKPFSFVVAALLLNESKISFLDLEERVITIGPKEGLSILKASLISSSALTLGLSPFIQRATMEAMVKLEH